MSRKSRRRDRDAYGYVGSDLARQCRAADPRTRSVLLRWQGRCAYCGKRPATLTIDHVVPRKLGGGCALSNLEPACDRCNNSKADRPVTEWRAGAARGLCGPFWG